MMKRRLQYLFLKLLRLFNSTNAFLFPSVDANKIFFFFMFKGIENVPSEVKAVTQP